MPLNYDSLYQDLQIELQTLEVHQSDPLALIETGFQIALRYRQRLPPQEDPASRVAYYKKWLPLFDGELRYCELCYYLEHFCPRGYANRREFWNRELQRKTRQLDQAPVLYAYYRSGANDLDEEFFGGDKGTAERNAELLAMLLALERYNRYLQENIGRFFPDAHHKRP